MLHDDVESMAADIPLAEKVRGYPKLAGQMGLRPEVAIFRRFGALNAENLLYFQAELALLERDLQEQQREQGPLLFAPERQRPTVADCLERTENPVFHTRLPARV